MSHDRVQKVVRMVTFRKLAADGTLLKTNTIEELIVQFNPITNLYGVRPILLEGETKVEVARVDPKGNHLVVNVTRMDL